ncbi:hypothetical protein E2C01_073634 [Portunus trituberculatus]|uniref:Uncharacterized protein n=1 Tax=Portunus trituberculatus TaxID=210409 RepID=A0A5B7I179_PORTR|nr:hypothetical protein [Portunus trituberculatus]
MLNSVAAALPPPPSSIPPLCSGGPLNMLDTAIGYPEPPPAGDEGPLPESIETIKTLNGGRDGNYYMESRVSRLSECCGALENIDRS